MAIRTSTRREDLQWNIDTIEAGLAWQRENEDGHQDAKMVAKLAEWKAELADLVARGEHGIGASIATGEGEGEKARLTDRPAAGAAARNQFGEFKVHYASAKQTGFIKSLLERKDLSPLADSVTIDVARLREQVAAGQVNKKAASDIITRLLALTDLAPTATTQAAKVTRPASEKQIGLIGRLAGERNWNDGQANLAHPASVIAQVLSGEPVESRDASAAIDLLLGCSKTRQPIASTLTRDDAGVYINAAGTLFRVYYGQQSGQMLMKKVVDGALEYVGKARLDGLRRATRDEFSGFGQTTGTCLHCERALDDPTSVDRGIGPVCWAKYDH